MTNPKDNGELPWYCVSRDGRATLCVDEEDARANAAHCDQSWRDGSPHRVVQLVDAVELTDATRVARHEADCAEAYKAEADALRAEVARLTLEHGHMRDRLDRAINAAEEHFGEDAIRYKLSLFKNGRTRNYFPAHMDGHWFALQRADNDAHIGLSLRLVEAQAEFDALRAELAREKASRQSAQIAVEALQERVNRSGAEKDREVMRLNEELARKSDAIQKLWKERDELQQDAERYRWLRNEAWAGYNQGRGFPHVFTVDAAGNRRTMLAEEALDADVDAAMAKEPR